MTGRPLISPAAWSRVVATIARTHDQTCQVERPTSGRDAGGAPVTGWLLVAEVDCSVSAASRQATERSFGGAHLSTADVEIGLPLDIEVLPSDRITVLGGLGETYHIVGVSPATESLAPEITVSANRAS